MNAMLQPVLVLNGSYEPINITGARRAIVLVLKGAAVIEESRGIPIHRDLMLPSVVRLRQFRRIPHRIQQLSRRSIYIRDNYTCQYCAEKFSAHALTLDHVIPRAQGGLNRWENLVTSCKPCNHTKDSRTPEEAGMKLLRVPRPLTIHTSRGMMRLAGHSEPTWQRYLFY